MATLWAPDILGRPFDQTTLPLGEDEGGPVVATLVRRRPSFAARLLGSLRDVDVLAVHGWSDFFFQEELAEFWTARGARFHALDLRRYGRSLREGDSPGFVSSLGEYDADIEAAIEVIRAGSRRPRRLVLLGHSTGGLTLALWAARHPGAASALVLNSPWLELQLGSVARQALAPLVEVRARLDPKGAHPAVDFGHYSRALAEIGTAPGPAFPPEWRPERGFPTHPAWLSAILAGQRTLAAGVEVGCPVLVLLSARSSSPFNWSDQSTATDGVLVVDDIARSATRLGRLITIARIDGAVHDVFLSRPEPRAQAFEVLGDWMSGLSR